MADKKENAGVFILGAGLLFYMIAASIVVFAPWFLKSANKAAITGVDGKEIPAPAYQMLGAMDKNREDLLDSKIDAFVLPDKNDQAGETDDWDFSIDGMVCEACVPIVRKILDKTAGVSASRVNFLTGRARVSLQSGVISRARIKKRLGRFGYRVVEIGEDVEAAETASTLIRVSLGLFLAMDVMLLSIPEYLGAFAPGEEYLVFYLRLAMALLCLPIMLWVARGIFLQAMAAARTLHPDMNFLVAAGATSAFAYSIYATAGDGPFVYFETAAFLPVMITAGMAIEERARRRARKALTGLVDVLPARAVVIREGVEHEVPPENLTPGDLVVLRPGERVPSDGTVTEGSILLDEIMLTGESVPRWRKPGDTARAGAMVLAGSGRATTATTLEQSLLALVVSSIERAEAFRDKRQVILDRVASIMAPAVIVLGAAATTVTFLYGASIEEGMMRGLAVVLFACPCALSLAAPLARAVAIGGAAAMGIAVSDAEALEVGKGPDRLVIDKTGTLTKGLPRLERVVTDAGAESFVIALAAAIDQGSSHPVAAALERAARKRGLSVPSASEVEEEAGLGRRGTVEGAAWLLGNARLLEAEGVEVPDWAAKAAEELSGGGMTVSFLAGAGRGVKGVLGFADELRAEAVPVMRAMQEAGVVPVLATGDSMGAAMPVARACGIIEVHAGLSPDGKRDLVVALKGEGHVVWVVGDGVNDAPALAVAELGIAMGRGVWLVAEAAHLTLADGRLDRLLPLLKLSGSLAKIVRQNLAWAVSYNGIGLPLAFWGLLRPVFFALAMMISSLCVVLNSLRLQKIATETDGDAIINGSEKS